MRHSHTEEPARVPLKAVLDAYPVRDTMQTHDELSTLSAFGY